MPDAPVPGKPIEIQATSDLLEVGMRAVGPNGPVVLNDYHGSSRWFVWGAEGFGKLTTEELRLDCTRPSIRDRVARALLGTLAPHVKLGPTAPGWFRWEYPQGSFWSLGNVVVFCESQAMWEAIRDANGVTVVRCVVAPAIQGAGAAAALAVAWNARGSAP